jgi:hypothetical protein
MLIIIAGVLLKDFTTVHPHLENLKANDFFSLLKNPT